MTSSSSLRHCNYDDDETTTTTNSQQQQQQEQQQPLFLFLTQKDIWINIMSFVGPGHYIFVAGVCKDFKELYQLYFSTLLSTTIQNLTSTDDDKSATAVTTEIPMVKEWIGSRSYHNGEKILAKVTHTFYSAAFSSVECAKLWNQDTAAVPPPSPMMTLTTTTSRRASGSGSSGRLGDNLVCETIAKTGNVEVMKWARGHYNNTNNNDGGGNDDHTSPYNNYEAHHQQQEQRVEHVGFGRYVRRPVVAPAAVQNNKKPLFPWNYWTCAFAAKFGHLDLLEFAIEEGCDWNLDKCASWAAQGGHLNILKWLRQHHQSSWNTANNKWISVFAAGGGHLDVLKWAYHHDNSTANGTDGTANHLWDGLTCAYAAMNGHFNILKWARNHGCPWDERTCNWASNNGYDDIAKWAYDNGCPWSNQAQQQQAQQQQGRRRPSRLLIVN